MSQQVRGNNDQPEMRNSERRPKIIDTDALVIENDAISLRNISPFRHKGFNQWH